MLVDLEKEFFCIAKEQMKILLYHRPSMVVERHLPSNKDVADTSASQKNKYC